MLHTLVGLACAVITDDRRRRLWGCGGSDKRQLRRWKRLLIAHIDSLPGSPDRVGRRHGRVGANCRTAAGCGQTEARIFEAWNTRTETLQRPLSIVPHRDQEVGR